MCIFIIINDAMFVNVHLVLFRLWTKIFFSFVEVVQ